MIQPTGILSARHLGAALSCGGVLVAASQASAQRGGSGNDNTVRLDNGVTRVVQAPLRDTVTVRDLASMPSRVVADIAAPHSVARPFLSVALSGGSAGLRAAERAC